MFEKKGRILAAGVVLALFATTAYAGTYCYWGGICDSNFDSWARGQGFSNGNAAISNYNWDALLWAQNNTDADIGSFSYLSNASWNSTAWWSNVSSFLTSLDAASSYEEQGRFYFLNGFTDKGCSDAAGGSAPYSYWWAPNKKCSFMSSYNSGWTWKSVMMHECGHQLRNDGWHHDYNSYPVCCMDTYDMANYATKAYCSQCIPVINTYQ
ncbi:MAG: hypothetical protein HYY16_19565 [Planctomycetes bacterium]|nr:hypothetical protein [Planctomycetota bacterium]